MGIISKLGFLGLAGQVIKILFRGVIRNCVNLPAFQKAQESFRIAERKGIRFLKAILFCATGGRLLTNGGLVFWQKNLLALLQTWLSHVSPRFGTDILLGSVKSLLLAVLVNDSVQKIHALLMVGMKRAKAAESQKRSTSGQPGCGMGMASYI